MGDHFTRTFALKLGPHEQGGRSNERAYGFFRILVEGVIVMEDGNTFGGLGHGWCVRIARSIFGMGGEEKGIIGPLYSVSDLGSGAKISQ